MFILANSTTMSCKMAQISTHHQHSLKLPISWETTTKKCEEILPALAPCIPKIHNNMNSLTISIMLPNCVWLRTCVYTCTLSLDIQFLTCGRNWHLLSSWIRMHLTSSVTYRTDNTTPLLLHIFCINITHTVNSIFCLTHILLTWHGWFSPSLLS